MPRPARNAGRLPAETAPATAAATAEPASAARNSKGRTRKAGAFAPAFLILLLFQTAIGKNWRIFCERNPKGISL